MIQLILRGIALISRKHAGDVSFSSDTHIVKTWRGKPIEKVTTITIILKEKI